MTKKFEDNHLKKEDLSKFNNKCEECKKKEYKFENLNLISPDNKAIKFHFCPIIAGTSFLDQIKSLENLTEIKFEKIGYPLLFFAICESSIRNCW